MTVGLSSRLSLVPDEVTEQWLGNPLVRRAVQESGWQTNGDTVGLLYRLLDLVDDPSEANEDTAHVTQGTRRSLSTVASSLLDGYTSETARRDLQGQLQVNALLLLDIGADPERMIDAGFSEALVASCVARHAPWRCEVLKKAREGRTPDEIRDAAPKVEWRAIQRVLASHGITVERPRHHRPMSPTVITLIKRCVYGGESVSSVAKELGMSKSHASSTVASYRAGTKYTNHRHLFEGVA